MRLHTTSVGIDECNWVVFALSKGRAGGEESADIVDALLGARSDLCCGHSRAFDYGEHHPGGR